MACVLSPPGNAMRTLLCKADLEHAMHLTQSSPDHAKNSRLLSFRIARASRPPKNLTTSTYTCPRAPLEVVNVSDLLFNHSIPSQMSQHSRAALDQSGVALEQK
eukprot:5789578-Amphidinium_carterae.1